MGLGDVSIAGDVDLAVNFLHVIGADDPDKKWAAA
jgi:hypothetical protein